MKTVFCNRCSVGIVDGVIIHERNCIDAQKYNKHICLSCGTEFTSGFQNHLYCDACGAVIHY